MFIGTSYGRIMELRTKDLKLNFAKQNVNGSPVTDIAYQNNQLFISYKNS